jgi:hypothetical protein
MPVTPDRAPYGPPSAVLEVVTRYRSRGLTLPITNEVLTRIGVSESLTARTMQALTTLDLVDEQGAPTPTLESLRLAPEDQYQKRLAEWLNGAYADILTIIDPATATDTQVRDAFRGYNPVGQQDRMVTLFLGLYAAAGIRPEKAAKPSMPRPPSIKVPPRKLTMRKDLPTQQRQYTNPPPQQRELPPALAGLMASLPLPDGGWTKETRDKFVSLFAITLDFCIPIVTPADIENRRAAEE